MCVAAGRVGVGTRLVGVAVLMLNNNSIIIIGGQGWLVRRPLQTQSPSICHLTSIIMVATMTETTAIERKMPDGAYHCYRPIDVVATLIYYMNPHGVPTVVYAHKKYGGNHSSLWSTASSWRLPDPNAPPPRTKEMRGEEALLSTRDNPRSFSRFL